MVNNIKRVEYLSSNKLMELQDIVNKELVLLSDEYDVDVDLNTVIYKLDDNLDVIKYIAIIKMYEKSIHDYKDIRVE
jgi:hypothetical protein